MSQVAFQMAVFNGDYVLEQALEALLPYGAVVAVEGPVQYFQERGYTTSTDRTNEILERWLSAHHVLHGRWTEKDEMMQAGASLIPKGTTHVWMVDADEVWEGAAMRRVLAELDEWDSVSFTPHTFFGGFERVLTGFETEQRWYRIQRWYDGADWATHRPPTVLHPEDRQPMRQHRHYCSPERFHHYSYVFPKQVRDKVAYYASWGQGVIPNYFQDVYLRWVNGGTVIRRAVEDKYRGVHEWLPHRRGGCYTLPYEGRHPESVREKMPFLLERFQEELAEVIQ